MNSLMKDENLSEQLLQHSETEMRELLFFSPLLRKGAIIMASFYSPVEAPAPDSAMNHGWLMGISHTHPIDTHPHTNTNQGNPYSLRQKMLLQQTVSYILTLLSTACEILIDYRLFGVLCCTFNISGNVTFTYLQRGKCDPIVFLWMGIV